MLTGSRVCLAFRRPRDHADLYKNVLPVVGVERPSPDDATAGRVKISRLVIFSPSALPHDSVISTGLKASLCGRRDSAIGFGNRTSRILPPLGSAKFGLLRLKQQPLFSVAVAIAAALKIPLGELAGIPSHEINLSGDWWASWQTYVGGEEIITAQEIRFSQEGDLIRVGTLTRGISVDEGGYHWNGELRL
jgi:hypothetical protein